MYTSIVSTVSAARGRVSYISSRRPTTGWLMSLVPVRCRWTLCAAHRAEVLAAHGQLPNEGGQGLVVGVTSGLGAQDPDGVIRSALPLDPEVLSPVPGQGAGNAG